MAHYDTPERISHHRMRFSPSEGLPSLSTATFSSESMSSGGNREPKASWDPERGLSMSSTLAASPTSPSFPKGEPWFSKQLTKSVPEGIPDVHPMTPHQSSRYNRRAPTKVENYTITAGRAPAHNGRRRSMPDDWNEHIHPEGSRYHVHKPSGRLITESDITDEGTRGLVINCSASLYRRAEEEGCGLDMLDVELWIDVRLSENGPRCGYYFADHEFQTIFWLDPVDSDGLNLNWVSTEEPQEHMNLQLTYLYWVHCEYFPVHRDLPKEAEHDLVATLTQLCIDTRTSHSSTSPFDSSQLETFLGAMRALKHSRGREGQRNCVIARLTSEVYNGRFLNYYGARSARLYRDQFVDDHKWFTWWLRILSLMLFDAPSMHYALLHELYIDQMVYRQAWLKATETRLSDWHDIILWAAVILTANMAFMAIFNSPDDIKQQSTSITASLISTFLSSASIIIALLYALKERSRTSWTAAEAKMYLDDHAFDSLIPLAIQWSIPFGLFMWSMAAFIIAILIYSCQSTLFFREKVVVLAVVAALGLIILRTVIFFWTDELGLVEELLTLKENTKRAFSKRRAGRVQEEPLSEIVTP